MKSRFQIIFLFFLFALQTLHARIYTTGNKNDITTPTRALVCLAGGGDDDLWAAGWKAMLRASGGGDKVNSVKTILITNAHDVNDPKVERAILDAEMIFFAGGDQSLYIRYFKNSKLLASVEYAMNIKKIPVGGTSAWLAGYGPGCFE